MTPEWRLFAGEKNIHKAMGPLTGPGKCTVQYLQACVFLAGCVYDAHLPILFYFILFFSVFHFNIRGSVESESDSLRVSLRV